MYLVWNPDLSAMELHFLLSLVLPIWRSHLFPTAFWSEIFGFPVLLLFSRSRLELRQRLRLVVLLTNVGASHHKHRTLCL